MGNEAKQILEVTKPKTINLTMTDKAHANVTRLQDRFKKKTGGFINQKNLINKILETASL